MLWQAPLALGLDLWLADPKNLPHPVQGIGLAANALERPARKAKNPRMAGVAVLFFLLCLTGGLVACLTNLGSGLGALFSLYFCWSGLALGGLVRDGRAALAAVEEAEKAQDRLTQGQLAPDQLVRARQAVQMLVSRDTKDMDASELYRSVAESVSENFNDAFVAPWFWLCLGGPVGLWLYKTVSTMDSMWGYKNERWEHLGWAAARLDDLLAFIPARLSVLFMLLTAWFERLPWKEGPAAVLEAARLSHPACLGRRKKTAPYSPGDAGDGRDAHDIRDTRGRGTAGMRPLSGWPGWRVAAEQANKSASPNAGWPMTAAAWLFDGRSGGVTPYGGVYVAKPLMGPQHGRWNADNTEALISHARLAGVAGAALMLAATALASAVL